MRKVALSLLFIILTTLAASAQRQGKVTATLLDAETEEGMPGAIVTFVPSKEGEKERYITSGYKGSIETMLPYDDYTMKISFLGYETLEQSVKVSAAQVSLGTLVLKPAVTEIETVVKEVQAIRTSQQGDTVSYSAGAFKVSTDADVEGLLKKMPGITISNGEVEAQGESVKKVFVDGKEFFGDDVTTAIKSLPAEAVDKIEVYNKLSDNAEFSGMDDGEGYKALNIVTKPGMRNGQFGKLYAGYGYQPETEGMTSHHKYNVGGNVNVFHGDHRISFIGLFNNINQQNFSFEDILGVAGGGGRGMGAYMMRPESGVASVNSLGVNYSGTWGKNDQVKFEGSYFFNSTRTKNRSLVDKWYETPSPLDTLHTEGYSLKRNSNHRLSARLEWKISENQSLMSRTSASYQANDPYSTTLGRQWGESGYSIIDNFSEGENWGYRVSEFLSYRAKLGKPGRTINIDGSMNYNHNDSRSKDWSNKGEAFQYVDPADTVGHAPIDLRYQRSLSPSTSYYLSGNVTYNEPLSDYSQLSLQYRVSYDFQEQDRRTYVTQPDFNIAGLTPDAALSKASNSGYLVHRVGPGYRLSKDRNTLILNVNFQHATLTGDVESSAKSHIRHTYNDVTYFAMGQLYFNPQNSIRLFIDSRTSNPGITQLQDVYNLSNTQYISKGNPNLNPSYSHNVRLHYVNSNVEKGRTFMWMFSFNSTSNYIASSIDYNAEISDTGEFDEHDNPVIYHPLQYTTYTNMDGDWSLRTHLSYGLPVSWLRSNLNLMGGVSYSVSPSLIDGERNESSNIGYDFGAVLGSNISENVDFTFAWQGTYNEAKNSLAKARNAKNQYFNHMASASFKLVFGPGITLTANAAYSQYIGFTNDYDDSYVLCNAYVGKKLFRNQRGELMFGVNDIFNQNTAFSRSTGSGYTQNAYNSVIGRYYTVQFVYNLRLFGKKGSRNIEDYEGMGGGSHRGPGGGRPPMGPPPHM